MDTPNQLGVIGMRDVNPIVAGNGIKKLKDAEIEVVEGVLQDEAKKLNEIFIKNMTEKKCFVALKCATTLDGKISMPQYPGHRERTTAN